MVEMAWSTITEERHELARLRPLEEDLSITICSSGTLGLPSRSKTISRGAGCLKGARPDLWGAGEGDFPRLPDRFLIFSRYDIKLGSWIRFGDNSCGGNFGPERMVSDGSACELFI